jgi:predicted nucleic acid-binding protein
LTILDCVSAASATYTQIRARLERAGRPIGALDALIVAQAVRRKLTLISNNRTLRISHLRAA